MSVTSKPLNELYDPLGEAAYSITAHLWTGAEHEANVHVESLRDCPGTPCRGNVAIQMKYTK